MVKDISEDNIYIFIEDFNPSTIPIYSSNLNNSLISNSILSIASLNELFGLKAQTPP